jgi:hypothetical protein
MAGYLYCKGKKLPLGRVNGFEETLFIRKVTRINSGIPEFSASGENMQPVVKYYLIHSLNVRFNAEVM